MAHIKANTNLVILSDDFNELMISNDEDKIFDKFIEYLPLICKEIYEGRFNTIDIKRLFSLNLKIFDILMYSDDFKESFDQEKKDELQNVYDKTYYIVNNIENESYIKEEMLEAINVVKEFWDNKFEEQKALKETLKETNNVLEDGLNQINNSIKLKEISDFGKNNVLNKNENVTKKALEYIEEMKKMLLDYPKSLIIKVHENIKNDTNYYSKAENISKERVDELTINNIISCSMIMLAIK